MDINTKEALNKTWKIFYKVVVGVLIFFILLMIIRLPFFLKNKKTDEIITKIHATKLTMDDVMGVNLPPEPGIEADKTVEGIDVNNNGIRDDVELAIFKEYPDSAKTRAVLLQYALVLQMEMTQPFENEKNVTELAREEARADTCVGDTLVPRETPESWRTYGDVEKIDMYINSIDELQLNTDERKKAISNFNEKIRSFGPMDSEKCDIDLSTLPN